MSGNRRTLQFVTAAAVVVAWVVVYLGVITFAPPAYDPAAETATKINRDLALLLAIPAAVYVAAALVLLHHLLSGAGAQLAATDPPGRMLVAVVATLPEHRRDWGAAMTAELAEVPGPSARWRFALSCAWAALWLPFGGRLTVFLVSGVAAAVTVAAAVAAGAAVPGLAVFAVSFAGLTGALMMLAAARSRRVRFLVPAATVLVAGGVAAAVAMTVVLLLREPSVAQHLPPARAVFLAAILATCLWVAMVSPRSLGTNRLTPHIGAGAALLYVAAMQVAVRIATDSTVEPDLREAVNALVALLIFFGSAALFFLSAAWGGKAGGSFRSGVQAAAWTAIAYLPLTFAMSLNESLRIFANGGGVGFDHLAGPVGVILDDAVFWHLVYDPVVAIPCAVFGAAFGAAIASYKPAPPVSQAELRD